MPICPVPPSFGASETKAAGFSFAVRSNDVLPHQCSSSNSCPRFGVPILQLGSEVQCQHIFYTNLRKGKEIHHANVH